jgi:hypothetical protein
MLVKDPRTKNRTVVPRSGGTSVLEAVLGAVLLAGVLTTGLDIAILYMGYQCNLSVSREAARSASMAKPSITDTNGNLNHSSPIYAAALDVFEKRGPSSNSWISKPRIISVSLDGLRFQESTAYGAPISGFVTVKSATDVFLPVTIKNIVPDSVTMQATISYPITAVSEPAGQCASP